MSMDNKEEPQEHSTEEVNQQETAESEEFSFLQETIKEEPVNRRKLFAKLAKVAGLGLIFGLAASLGFCALKPWAETTFRKDASKVTIPKDEETDEEEQGEAKDQQQVPQVLTVENYRELSKALYEVAETADKSVAEVIGIRGDEGWVEANYDEVNSTSGVIVADNGQQLLILINTSILKDAKSLTVVFSDGSAYAATLKKKDETIGLAVVGVDRTLITSSTWGKIKVATLGNSNIVNRGDAVIALGKPFGYAQGLGYGVISSAKNKAVLVDGSYDLILTDIVAAGGTTGAIVNLTGEVIGIIRQNIHDGETQTQISALAISDLKEEIELLSNGTSVPYIGITGADVTDEVTVTQGVPKGVYVKEVAADSPAMQAGIQSGDVITKVDNTTVSTLVGYRSAVLNQRAGDKIKVQGQRSGTNGYVNIDYTVTVGSNE